MKKKPNTFAYAILDEEKEINVLWKIKIKS